MGEKKEKDPKVKDAVITEDGCLIATFNIRIYPHTAQVIFTPDALLALAQDYGVIPPPGDTDFPGVPIVDHDSIYEEREGGAPAQEGPAEEEDPDEE